MEKILIFAAHSDDAVIGMGGTIAKASRKGNKVLTVIFTTGEKSHPHLKKHVIKKQRISETARVDKLLGRESMNLNLEEGKLRKEFENKVLRNKIKNLIRKFNPTKVYTLSSSDPHPDHRIVNKFTLDILDELKYKKDVYGYEVWKIDKRGVRKARSFVELYDYRNNALQRTKDENSKVPTEKKEMIYYTIMKTI